MKSYILLFWAQKLHLKKVPPGQYYRMGKVNYVRFYYKSWHFRTCQKNVVKSLGPKRLISLKFVLLVE